MLPFSTTLLLPMIKTANKNSPEKRYRRRSPTVKTSPKPRRQKNCLSRWGRSRGAVSKGRGHGGQYRSLAAWLKTLSEYHRSVVEIIEIAQNAAIAANC